MQGYCVKCQALRDMTNTSQVPVNGNDGTKGNCAVCSTVIYVVTRPPFVPDIPKGGSK